MARIFGTYGHDTRRGTSGPDTIYGYPSGGDPARDLGDTLSGLGGNDLIFGGGGFDLLFGGDGADTLNGGAGSDRFVGGSGDDTMNGGDGETRSATLIQARRSA